MVLGLLLAISRLRAWAYQVPMAWFVLAVLLGGMFFKTPPRSPRYVTLAPVVCLFIAFAADSVLHATQRLVPRRPAVPYVLVGGSGWSQPRGGKATAACASPTGCARYATLVQRTNWYAPVAGWGSS
jgi:hypothetical protein